jgi:uncharacterized membrane protein
MTNYPDIPFNRAAVKPMECLRGGWELIKDQIWLFIAMALVGMLVGSALPFGILLGPMMCGLYLAYFKKRRGEPIEFGTLFKGFDYFGQSVIAAVMHTVPIVVIIVGAYIVFYAIFIIGAIAMSNDQSGAGLVIMMLFFLVFYVVIMVLIVFVSIGFTFAYPLIVDRGMQGFDAVKLSFKAAMGNFVPLLGLALLSGLLASIGVLACYVGVFFVLPVNYAAIAVAYEQVFGLSSGPMTAPGPPPPPTFN